MKLKFFENASGKMHRAGFKLHQASPDILVVVGVVGVVAATVMACKATLKVDEVISAHEKKVKEINETAEDPQYASRYSQEDCETDLKTVKVKTAVKLVKLYAPAVIVGTLAIGCIVGSHYILQKRNAGLMAAYTAIDTSFREYRKRVAEKYGEEAEKDIRRGVRRETIIETVKDENGQEQQVERTVETRTPGAYSRMFDCSCKGWERNAHLNWFTLRNIQSVCNRKLQLNGHLYLNDVYEMLDMPFSEAGQVVGWIAEPTDSAWENFVDFGLGDEPEEDADPDMWITPNVQGVIVNKLKWRKV